MLCCAGYAHLAQVLYKGLAIPPSPPAPPAPPAPPGVWVYQNQGLGKLFIPAANFTANKNSGRAGKLGWDACAHGANGTRFDNGVPLWPGTGNVIGAFAASGSAVLRGAGGCDLTYSYHPTMSAPFAAADGIVYRPDWLYLEMEEKATGRSP